MPAITAASPTRIQMRLLFMRLACRLGYAVGSPDGVRALYPQSAHAPDRCSAAAKPPETGGGDDLGQARIAAGAGMRTVVATYLVDPGAIVDQQRQGGDKRDADRCGHVLHAQ